MIPPESVQKCDIRSADYIVCSRFCPRSSQFIAQRLAGQSRCTLRVIDIDIDIRPSLMAMSTCMAHGRMNDFYNAQLATQSREIVSFVDQYWNDCRWSEVTSHHSLFCSSRSGAWPTTNEPNTDTTCRAQRWYVSYVYFIGQPSCTLKQLLSDEANLSHRHQ